MTKSRASNARSPLLIIFLVVFIDLVGFGIVIPILPYYARQFGASATALGWLMTSYSAMQFFFAPVWGRLSDRIGRRPVLLISMLGTLVSLVWLGFAHSLLWLFIGRTFAGICGANISTATAYIADVTAPENRAKGMGMIGAAFGLGFIFGPAIGGILSRYGYNTPMFFAAGLAALNWVFAYAKLPEPPITAELRAKNRTKRFDRTAILETFGDKRTRLATLAFFIVTLAVTQMEVTFALFMQARHGFGAQTAGWLLAYLGLIMVLIQGGLIGKLSKVFGERRLVLTGTMFMAVSLVLLAQATILPQLLIALAFLALGNGVTNPSLSSLASQGARAERRGATMGVYQSAGSLSRVLGPPLAGYLYDTKGIAAPFLIAAGFTIIAFITASRFPSGLGSRKKPAWLIEPSKIWRAEGFRGLLKRYGWKFVAVFFVYYLIRDISLYIVLPWVATKGVMSIH